jgi:hypothetical protein
MKRTKAPDAVQAAILMGGHFFFLILRSIPLSGVSVLSLSTVAVSLLLFEQ